MKPRMKPRLALYGPMAAASLACSPVFAEDVEIAIQSSYPPLQLPDASPGGAHPAGGPTAAFVEHANAALAPHGIRFALHVSGDVNPADAEQGVLPALVSSKDFGSLHEAVASGRANGGLDATAGLPANSGLAFGEMMSGGAPFGLEVDELIAFVYAGGGLELMQSFYDESFDDELKVLPIGITSAQGAGFFQTPLPDPDTDPELSPEEAMRQLCGRKIIVRWPDGGAGIWSEACERVGMTTKAIMRETRCADSAKACDLAENPDNAVINDPEALTFGGFAPGVSPHVMYANGNIDAFELNMPNNDIQFLKLATGKGNAANAEVDLSDIAPAYAYVGAWHQPTIFVELVLNRAVWDALSDDQRTLIETAARSSVLNTLAVRLERQGEAIAFMQAQGTTYLRWPTGLIDLLRAAAPDAMAKQARAAEEEGDDTLARLHSAMTTYRDEQALYSDFGDINQGQSGLPTSP